MTWSFLFFLSSAVNVLIRPFVVQVGENFVPPLLDAVLIDYQRNVPAAREPEVLSTMATIVNKLGGHITSEIPQIFDAVFECTLNMINKVKLSDDQRRVCSSQAAVGQLSTHNSQSCYSYFKKVI